MDGQKMTWEEMVEGVARIKENTNCMIEQNNRLLARTKHDKKRRVHHRNCNSCDRLTTKFTKLAMTDAEFAVMVERIMNKLHEAAAGLEAYNERTALANRFYNHFMSYFSPVEYFPARAA